MCMILVLNFLPKLGIELEITMLNDKFYMKTRDNLVFDYFLLPIIIS
jgi:hypothetical protein